MRYVNKSVKFLNYFLQVMYVVYYDKYNNMYLNSFLLINLADLKKKWSSHVYIIVTPSEIFQFSLNFFIVKNLLQSDRKLKKKTVHFYLSRFFSLILISFRVT